MVTPSQTNALSPYTLPEPLRAEYFQVEADLSYRLATAFDGRLYEYTSPNADPRLIKALCHRLADFGWAVVADGDRLTIWPRPVSPTRQPFMENVTYAA